MQNYHSIVILLHFTIIYVLGIIYFFWIYTVHLFRTLHLVTTYW